MQGPFNGLNLGMGNLARLCRAQTRSISPENFTGEKGKGGMAVEGTGVEPGRGLGQGWKVSPSVIIKGGETFELADIEGPGAIQHIWMTPTGCHRFSILRIYWDDEETPSVECPVGDFFASGWNKYAQLSSLAVCVNPGSGFNCYWEMPFGKRCRMTMENLDEFEMTLYYQVDYALTDIDDDRGYFHARFRRSNPVGYKTDHVIVDEIKGWGHYVGTYLAWGSNSCGWWGEGEIKFFMDGDDEFPTICGTGTEDYFGGSYDFLNPETGEYQTFCTAYSGLSQVIKPDGKFQSQSRFGMYRWHIMDPIRFERDLKVTIQALGWHKDARYVHLQDDISSVAYWYQREPHAAYAKLPEKGILEVI